MVDLQLFLVAVGHNFLSHARMHSLFTMKHYAAAAAAGKSGCLIVISMAKFRLIAQRGKGRAHRT